MHIVLGSLIATVVLSACQTSASTRPPLSQATNAAFAEVLVSQLNDPDDEEAVDGMSADGIGSATQSGDDEEPSSAVLPNRKLDQETLYKYLVSEIAAQRGNTRLAAQGFLDLARTTKDPRFAKRATEFAFQAKMNEAALEASRLWYQFDKTSKPAKQSLTSALISSNRLNEAKPLLQELVASEANPAQALLQLNSVLSRHQDKAAVLSLVKEVASTYPQAPEGHLAVAQAAVAAGKFDIASTAVSEALRLRPEWEGAHLFNAQLIQLRESQDKALEYLAGVVATYPKAKDLRLGYARALISAKKLLEARAQYEKLLEELPNHPDLVVTTALLSLQMNDFRAAERYLTRALDLDYKDPESIKYYLGQTFEEQKRMEEAMLWYRSVAGGDQYITAQTRYAYLLAKQNKLAEAREFLGQVPTQNDEQKINLAQAEAQLLREAKSFQESYDVLKKALEGRPDHLELLYDLAMVAERLHKIDVLETSLRRVIQLKPDHAQAYNALGYTLADRNMRLPEAKQYVEKALKLSPDDAFILDSMGWVHYRMGNNKDGLDYLQRAFSQRQDPEIAAHLGEVLWKTGRTADAEKIWRDSLKEHPDNDILVETVKRFIP